MHIKPHTCVLGQKGRGRRRRRERRRGAKGKSRKTVFLALERPTTEDLLRPCMSMAEVFTVFYTTVYCVWSRQQS